MARQRREQVDERVARHLREERARRIQDANAPVPGTSSTIGCRMFSITGVPSFLADGTPQVVEFDDPDMFGDQPATVFDTGGFFDFLNDPARFVIPVAGIYLAIFRAAWSVPNEDIRYSSFTKVYRAGIEIGVMAEWEMSADAGSGGAIRSVASGIALLEVGDELETDVRATGTSNAAISPCSFDLAQL